MRHHLGRGFKKKRNVALDSNGKVIEEISSEAVEKHTLEFLDDDDSKIILLVAEKSNGELLVNVMGVPSRRIYDIMVQALEQYDRALKVNGI